MFEEAFVCVAKCVYAFNFLVSFFPSVRACGVILWKKGWQLRVFNKLFPFFSIKLGQMEEICLKIISRYNSSLQITDGLFSPWCSLGGEDLASIMSCYAVIRI